MSDYGRPLAFGANVDPNAAALDVARRVARRSDELGLDLVGIQDHPYQRRFLDTWMLIADLLALTERVRVFPNVANLPLRGAAMIAKQAASLDVLSGGRFELGLGAGSFWEAIGAMGGPVRSPREAVEALEEAVAVIRRFWTAEPAARVPGRYYRLDGVHPGPAPAHDIEIWLGAYKPRMLNLTGRVADGVSISLPYAPPEQAPELQRRVDEGADEAGRSPSEIRRLYNLVGELGGADATARWIEELTRYVRELGFDTFIFWPTGGDPVAQLERFAADVVPRVREVVARERGATGSVTAA
jgi:alkanesulfonate monooxygenase SsuD/methylene tetrahydromethanopterin reductase-like flavin-dependent oxidoreductase (luciferase family)